MQVQQASQIGSYCVVYCFHDGPSWLTDFSLVRSVPFFLLSPQATMSLLLSGHEDSNPYSRPEGWRPGQDVAGVIVQPAADGSGPEKGARVVAWVDGAGWSQRVAAPTVRMAALPDNVSFASAATLPVAGVTALRILRQGGSLLGQRVLITGAAGGVGRFAVQLAALAGAEVTGVVSNSDRASGLSELGATTIVSNVLEAEGLFDLI